MKRLPLAIMTSGILGVFCIIGISMRVGLAGNEIFLAATYVNRILMGIVIGLVSSKKGNQILRGAFLGGIVSFSLYISTDFYDTAGFIAGIVYGIIIDFIATKYGK